MTIFITGQLVIQQNKLVNDSNPEPNANVKLTIVPDVFYQLGTNSVGRFNYFR